MIDWTSQAKANRTNRGAQGIAQKCAGQESLCPWKGVSAVVLQQRYHFLLGLNVASVGTSLLTPCPIGGPRFVWCYPGMFWSACCRWDRGDQYLCGSCKAWLVVHVAIVLQSIEISSTDEGGPECFWATLTINNHATAMFQIFSLFRCLVMLCATCQCLLQTQVANCLAVTLPTLPQEGLQLLRKIFAVSDRSWPSCCGDSPTFGLFQQLSGRKFSELFDQPELRNKAILGWIVQGLKIRFFFLSFSPLPHWQKTVQQQGLAFRTILQSPYTACLSKKVRDDI